MTQGPRPVNGIFRSGIVRRPEMRLPVPDPENQRPRHASKIKKSPAVYLAGPVPQTGTVPGPGKTVGDFLYNTGPDDFESSPHQ
jgi:hypothetical protein